MKTTERLLSASKDIWEALLKQSEAVAGKTPATALKLLLFFINRISRFARMLSIPP